MSDLTFTERSKLEALFKMGSGYVLDFSDRTFRDFVAGTTGIDIYVEKYKNGSGSKANRMRGFWQLEPNHVVGKLISAILSGGLLANETDEALRQDCQRIATRLNATGPVESMHALDLEVSDRNFEILANSAKRSIEDNQPEAALDRLHTFLVRLIRKYSRSKGIEAGLDKPLHSIFGEYVKALRRSGAIKSRMTETILKSTISVLDAYSDVRNNQSPAHDNEILNYNESIMILNNVCNLVRFLNRIEEDTDSNGRDKDAIPF